MATSFEIAPMIPIDEAVRRVWEVYEAHIARQLDMLADMMIDQGADDDTIATEIEEYRQWFIEKWPSVEADVRRCAVAFLLEGDAWPSRQTISPTLQ
jgi:hypothetical protein